MYRKLKTTLAVVAAIFFTSPVMAQESLVEYTYLACETNIEQFCNQVTLGEGRLLHCLAAHEDKISDECEYALYAAATVIQELTIAIVEELNEAVEYLVVECGTDIEEHCADVDFGEGRILMCLDENAEDLTEQCTVAVGAVFSE
jgi:hypothetical protein